MKKLVNKIFTIDKLAEKEQSYYKLLKLVLDMPPQAGFTTSEIRERVRIMAKMEENQLEILLTETEAKKCEELVKAFTWGVASMEFVAFEDAITAMPVVKIQEQK